MTIQACTGPSVCFRDVSLTIKENVVLDRVNLTVESSSVHCIIGPNGGGKSSLIKSLLAQTRHTGEISITWSDGPRITGYVPQALTFDATIPLTVMDFLTLSVQKKPAIFGPVRGVSKAITRALTEVKMNGKEKRLISKLSGGERQRVLFAQALIPSPQLLVLDEPLQSLDEQGAADVSEIIKGLARAGTTVLWVNHDLSLVGRIADAVSCVNRAVLFSGTPATVLTNDSIKAMFSAYPGRED